MKKSIIIGLGIILLVVVSIIVRQHFRPPSDAEISRKIVGTWKNRGSGVMALAPDGSFSNSWKAGTRIRTFEGTWSVKDGEFILTSTKRDAIPFSDVNRSKIILADDHDLIYVDVGNDHQTNSLRR
jgi:hypothetical protein